MQKNTWASPLASEMRTPYLIIPDTYCGPRWCICLTLKSEHLHKVWTLEIVKKVSRLESLISSVNYISICVILICVQCRSICQEHGVGIEMIPDIKDIAGLQAASKLSFTGKQEIS